MKHSMGDTILTPLIMLANNDSKLTVKLLLYTPLLLVLTVFSDLPTGNTDLDEDEEPKSFKDRLKAIDTKLAIQPSPDKRKSQNMEQVIFTQDTEIFMNL